MTGSLAGVRSRESGVRVFTPAPGLRLPLAPNAKIDFNRIFAKSEIKARASASQTFFKANVTGRNTFKAPARTGTAPQDDPDNDSGGGGSKGTWIAVGVILGVLTIAIIGLRADRNRDTNVVAH